MPFFAVWPARIEPGTRCSSLCGNTDIAATLLEIAGGEPPEDIALDSRSFLPMLLGEPEPEDWPESLLIEAGNTKAVVTKRWKYIANRVTPEIAQMMADRPGEVYWSGVDHHNYGTETHYPGYWEADQLYDLESDLYEQNNLVKSPAYCTVLPDLIKKMNEHISRLPHTFGEFGQ
jgi:arylsulfatase A-like enzyme